VAVYHSQSILYCNHAPKIVISNGMQTVQGNIQMCHMTDYMAMNSATHNYKSQISSGLKWLHSW